MTLLMRDNKMREEGREEGRLEGREEGRENEIFLKIRDSDLWHSCCKSEFFIFAYKK